MVLGSFFGGSYHLDIGLEPHESVLEVLVQPEVCNVSARVGVPPAVLPARGGMHVEDGVDAVLGTRCDGVVEMLEAGRFEHARIEVILKVAVTDRDPDAVEAEGLEERGIGLRKEMLQELHSDSPVSAFSDGWDVVPCRRRTLICLCLGLC